MLIKSIYDTLAPPTGQNFDLRKSKGIMKKEKTELDNKLKLLKLKIAKTEKIIAKRDRQALERLRLRISSLSNAVDELKLKIAEGKISKGDSKKEIAL